MEANTPHREEPLLPTEEQHKEAQQLQVLLRLKQRRRMAAPPDTDQAWSNLVQQHTTRRHAAARKRAATWRLATAAGIGVAGMLALLCTLRRQATATQQTATDIVVLQYDKEPQRIRIEQEGRTLHLSHKDSISFHQAIHATDTETSSPIHTQRLSTPRGMDLKVILPDGSRVWLNAESSLEFFTTTKDTRQVWLQGEAYFEVAPGSPAPFVVSSEQMSVRATGTQFNLRSYPAEQAYVSLIDGRVEVMRPNAQLADTTLVPGQEAWYDKQGHVCVCQTDTKSSTQWVKEFFYFSDAPLVEVLRELGRWYNVGVVFRRPGAQQHHVHFSAGRNEPIEDILERLNTLPDIQMRMEGNYIAVY